MRVSPLGVARRQMPPALKRWRLILFISEDSKDVFFFAHGEGKAVVAKRCSQRVASGRADHG